MTLNVITFKINIYIKLEEIYESIILAKKAAWMVLYLVLFLNGKTKYSTLLIIILLVIVLISMSIYPRSSEYCSCGHRWYKKYTFKETTSSSKTNKKGITKETFVHVFNCNCVCNNCKKVKNYEIKADGGYNITTPDGKHESHRIKQNIYMQNKNLLNI